MDNLTYKRLLAFVFICGLACEVAVAKGQYGSESDHQHKGYKDQQKPHYSPKGDKRYPHKGDDDDKHVQSPSYSHELPPPYSHIAPAPSKGDDHKPKPALYKKPSVALAVEGVVSCQDCKYVGATSLAYAKPLAGAKVKLACQAGLRYKKFFYSTALTDSHGYFFLRVPSFDFNQFLPLKNCKVYLVSSPDKMCSTPTNINYGKAGAPLRLQKAYSDELLYSVGPFAFAPAPCKKTPPAVYTTSYPPPSPPTYNNKSPSPVYKSPPVTYPPPPSPAYKPPPPPVHTSPSPVYKSPPAYPPSSTTPVYNSPPPPAPHY